MNPTFAIFRTLISKLILSLAVGGLFLWLAKRGGMPLIPSRQALGQVNMLAVGIYVVILLATHFFRASRWRFLIAPVAKISFRDVIALNWIGFFAIFLLPLRMGELARPALTKLRHGVPISAGFGTVAVERVVDGLLTSLCVAWALFALPRRASEDPLVKLLPHYGYLALIVFVSAFFVLGLFLWKRQWAIHLTERIVSIFSERLAHVLAQKVNQLANGVRSLADPKMSAGFLCETFLYWMCNALGMWCLAVGCGLPISLGHAVGLMGVLALGILLPAGPGLFGNFQLAISAGLQLYLAPTWLVHEGSAFIFLLYSIQAVVIAMLGIIPLVQLNLSFMDLIRPQAQSLPPAG